MAALLSLRVRHPHTVTMFFFFTLNCCRLRVHLIEGAPFREYHFTILLLNKKKPREELKTLFKSVLRNTNWKSLLRYSDVEETGRGGEKGSE